MGQMAKDEKKIVVEAPKPEPVAKAPDSGQVVSEGGSVSRGPVSQ